MSDSYYLIKKSVHVFGAVDCANVPRVLGLLCLVRSWMRVHGDASRIPSRRRAQVVLTGLHRWIDMQPLPLLLRGFVSSMPG